MGDALIFAGKHSAFDRQPSVRRLEISRFFFPQLQVVC